MRPRNDDTGGDAADDDIGGAEQLHDDTWVSVLDPKSLEAEEEPCPSRNAS